MQINAASNSISSLQGLSSVSGGGQLDKAREIQKNFRQFVGEMFYGQMMKAMRKSLEKPAYFHGGRAEEVFQGQLDQMMAQEMTEASADQLADPMFRQQFPHEAKLLDAAADSASPSLDDLRFLNRR